MSRTDTISHTPELFGRMLDWLKAHFSSGDEFAGFSHDEFGHMADDLGITRDDLVALSRNAPDNTALMDGMMRARGLDPDVVRNSFLGLLRDIERVCTRCRSVKQCRSELEAGTAAVRCHEYCPNAGTFDDLVEYQMGR